MEYSEGMKRLLPILLLVFSVGVGAADFNKGLAAYTSRDFATALR